MLNLQAQQILSELPVVRGLVASSLLVRARIFELLGRRYRSLDDSCRAARLAANPGLLRKLALARVGASVERIRSAASNPVVDDYLSDEASRRDASVFAMTGRGKADLLRDLIVLKKHTPEEKGVILLKYARTFSAVVALLDLAKLQQRYTFVLEPCWAGYCDPSILMHIAPGNPVVVMCFTDEDYRYIESVGAPLVPVRLGPADWVDADIFSPPDSVSKPYDLVMVANWGAHKRHAQLFRALQHVRDRDVRVLMCGFAWANRTAADIRREAAEFANPRVTLEILENVPQKKLAGYVSQSKVFVFLTRKEGDNKALVEAMFADVPAIVHDKTIGGAGGRVNAATGTFASDEQLAEKISYMLDHYREFTPRQWALANTGSLVSTRVLDETLRRAVTATGQRYIHPIVEKTNAPNLAYKDPASRAGFAADYDYILGCQRESSRS
jgi:glycosyltransferase involved in cell wall biosynthesis